MKINVSDCSQSISEPKNAFRNKKVDLAKDILKEVPLLSFQSTFCVHIHLSSHS